MNTKYKTEYDDYDCSSYSVCFDEVGNCDDGLDNDGDGYYDCADSDCSSYSGC